jgi:hypothetical protein
VRRPASGFLPQVSPVEGGTRNFAGRRRATEPAVKLPVGEAGADQVEQSVG